MKKILFKCIAIVTLVIMIFNLDTNLNAAFTKTASASQQINLSAAKYSSITEVFDWGPSVTKIILNVGSTLDSTSFSKKSFKVTMVKRFRITGDKKDTVANEVETISSAYVSDESGNKKSDGTYLTLVLKIKPSGNSPIYPSAGLRSKYAKLSFVIKTATGVKLKTTSGISVKLAPTTKSGFTGNRVLIAENFDLTGKYTQDKITMHYASYTPKTASQDQGSNPLIIWLHGAGEGGTDPLVTITGNKVVNLATDKIQAFFGNTGAYILAPEVPTMWMDRGDGEYLSPDKNPDGKSYYTEALKGLIDEYVTKHPDIDTNRIYIGGCSNGGYMTMNMIIQYPNYFAAAFPTCEAYYAKWLTNERLQKIVKTPIWFVQSKSDTTVVVNDGNSKLDDFASNAYRRLVAAGAKNVHYSLFKVVQDLSGKYFKSDNKTPYEYNGHFSWIYTLNNQCKDTINGKDVSLFEWLGQQSQK